MNFSIFALGDTNELEFAIVKCSFVYNTLKGAVTHSTMTFTKDSTTFE